MEEEKILSWESRAPVLPQIGHQILDKSQIWGGRGKNSMLGKSCTSAPPNGLAYYSHKRQRSCLTARPLPFLFGQQQSVTMWITQPFQKSPKVVKNRQKLTKIHKNHQTIDKNCTVGQKIELWSHCAPAKSPKIVKNRQKRQKNAQWDRKSWKIELWSHCAPHCTSCSSAVVLASSSSHCAAVLFLI